MKRLVQFPTVLHGLVSYLFSESGHPSTQFQADLCLIGCVGSGNGNDPNDPPNPNMAAPTGVTATDGSHDDKVVISWNAVVPPTGFTVNFYKLYRALATETNPANATLIATITAPTATYDDPVDDDLVVGTVYRYWLKAQNTAGTQVSAFSTGDNGNASDPSTTLDAIIDLRTSLGMGYSDIRLVWTPPAGATKYDVYRHTTDTFAESTLIWENVTPASTTLVTHPTSAPECWDNVGEILLHDTPPSEATDYYYWVVCKKDSPPAVSLKSNESLGRVNPPAIYNLLPRYKLTYDSDSVAVPVSATKMWAVLWGGGGGGGGGNSNYGGGGGGGGGIVIEAFAVTFADVIDLITTGTPNNTGNAPRENPGTAGTNNELEINSVSKLTADGGQFGDFFFVGGGSGGAGGSATGTSTPLVYDGAAGLPGVATAGGRSGYPLFQRRTARAIGTFPGYSGNAADDGRGGGGASAVPSYPDDAVGGWGKGGVAYIAFGT